MVLTEELALRIEAAAVAWSRAWMAGVAGIELGEFAPHVLAPCHPGRPDLDFQNRVNGLTPDDAELVPALLDWYASHGVHPWFELVPSDRSTDLLHALVDCPAVGFHAVAWAPLRPSPPAPTPAVGASDVDVETIDPDDDEVFATFCRMRCRAHDLPPEVVDQATADLGGWRHAAGATFYLARVEGVPAATAALTVTDGGLAYLADGATLPAFRGRGIQTRLIRRRLADAQRAGCELAASQAAFGSTSHRNLSREGLVHGFTKLVLRRGTEQRPHH
ncbi:MAG TPA: GNAT family N-acetyltransferase [Acidimicrobiales bacterium]|nr:GNAT family N-acetyltransferase [Acidimicrobiales bacterium]